MVSFAPMNRTRRCLVLQHPPLVRWLLRWHVALLCGALPFAPAAAGTATAYPGAPVELVVPYIQTSHPDLVARIFARDIQPYLPQVQVKVVNRVGDSGVLAATEVRHARPDGYTLLLARVATHAIAPALRQTMPYQWNDFTLLGLLEIEPQICMVAGDSPYRTLREFLDAVRQAPGKLRFGHTGESTILNLLVRYLLKLDGFKQSDLKAVDLSNGPGTVPENVIAGNIDFACTAVSASVVESIRGNRLRALFSTAAGRHPSLPQLKNAREVGFPDLANVVGWSALMGPLGMPAPVVTAWRQALTRLASDTAWNDSLQNLGALQTLGALKDSGQFMQDQVRLFRRIAASLEREP